MLHKLTLPSSAAHTNEDLCSVEVCPLAMQAKRRLCLHSHLCMCGDGLLTEEALLLVFKYTNWNPFLISSISRVCRWFKDLAKRVLWREFCKSRGPKMVPVIESGEHRGTVQGGWDALGRLMILCAGCHGSENVPSRTIRGHFVRATRFSKTSGRSFLVPQCRTDILYISDPCEHLDKNGEDDIGLFRGMFIGFLASGTRKMLVERGVHFDKQERCPYCLAKVWSMLHANMIPRSALRRLGADGDVEYFVCLNGHLHGRCSLLHLSESEDCVSNE